MRRGWGRCIVRPTVAAFFWVGLLLWPAPSAGVQQPRFDSLSLEHGLSQSSVFGLTEDSWGHLWIATEQGIDRCDGFGVDTWRYEPGSARSLTHSDVWAVLAGHKGMVWVGTFNGLNRIDPDTLRVRPFVPAPVFSLAQFSVQSDGLAQLCQDKLLILARESLWWLDLAGDDGVLNPLIAHGTDPSLLPKSWQAFDQQSAWLANARTLWRLHCDSMRLEQIESLAAAPAPAADEARARLARLPDGRLLWASGQGLRILDPSTVPIRSLPVALPDDWSGQAPRAVHVDDQSRIWARHGPDPSVPAFARLATSAEFGSPRGIAFSRDHRYLLVTTSRALWRLPLDEPAGSLERVPLDPALGNADEFFPIAELADATLAVGCRQGLHLVDPESGQHRTRSLGIEQAGSPARFVFSLAEAANSDLWLDTRGGGLVRIAAADLALHDPPAQRWTTIEGLPDNTIYAILEDSEGCLWLTGNRGLSQFCPEQNRLRNFSLHDGLQAYEFNGRVADIGPSGQFYFGGFTGVNSFRPEGIVDHPLPRYPPDRSSRIRADR